MGLSGNNSAMDPTSAGLTSAILKNNVNDVARLLERDVDPDDVIVDESTQTVTTPRQELMRVYRKSMKDAKTIGNPEEISTIRALFDTKCWRRGKIRAPNIDITVDGNLLDCAQFKASNLKAIVNGEVVCEEDSIWTSGFVELTTQKNMQLFGQTKLITAFLNVGEDIITNKNAKVAIDKLATIRAKNFYCTGEWYVEETIDIRLNGSSNFRTSSFLSSNHLFMATKENCIISGDWALNSMKMFVTEQFLATSSATIALKDSGSLVSKNYRNEGKLDVARNMQLITESIAQAENATIRVSEKFELMVLMKSDRDWYGLVTANTLFIITKNLLRCSGKICANFAEVQLINHDESQFILNGEMSVRQGALLFIGESENQVDIREQHHFPGFILCSGILNAQAIVAPGIAIELTNNSQTTLIGINSNNDHEAVMKTVLSCGWLYTHSESVLYAISDEDDIPQRFICEKTWIHKGTLRQTSTSANFNANYFFNAGKLTFFNFENHLLEAVFYVGERLVNKTTISSVILRVIGYGTLENCGTIMATNSVAIKIGDFINQIGLMKAQKISIEYLTTTCANLSGKVDADMSLSINATKSAAFDFLCVNIENEHFLLPQEQFSIKSSKLLRIATDIQYSKISMKANTIMFTDGQIVINATTNFPSFIVNISETAPIIDCTEQSQIHESSTKILLLVTEKGVLSTSLLHIQGQSKQLEFTIDGATKIDNVEVTETIETILVQGCGANQTLKQIIFHGKCLELGTLTNLETYMIDCNSMKVLKDSSVQLGDVKEDITQILAMENICVLGDVQVKKSLLFSSKADAKPSVIIEGAIMGATINSKLFHIDSTTLSVSGTIQRFETCEANANTTLDVLETGIFHTIQNLSVDGEWITWKGKISQCKKASLNAWGLLNSGEISKEIDEIEVHSGLVFSNIGQISGTLLTFGAPFIFNISLNNANGSAAMGTDASKGVLDIKSLVCLCSASQMLAESIQNTSVLLFKFATLTAAETPSNDQLKQWKSTVDLLNENFSSESVSYKDVCRSMQAASGSDSKTEIELRDVIDLYATTKTIVNQMNISGISTFSVPILVDALMKANTHFQNVSSIKERLLQVPKLAREIYNKGIRKLKSLHETYGFGGIKATDPTKKGIQESGMFSYHSGILSAGSGYTAMFIESWWNDGTVSSSAGDIEIGSKTVKQSSAGRLLSAYGSVFLDGDSVDVSNISAVKEIWLQVSEFSK
jgi:hypothetical protein